MSEESPQKGWDSWFSGEPDSSGDEPQAPEHSIPPTPSGSVPETEAEQTNWTVPAFGAVLEGREPQDPADGADAASAQQSSQPPAEEPQPEPQPQSPPQPATQAALESQATEVTPVRRESAPAADALPTQQVQAVSGPGRQPQALEAASADTWQPPQAADATQVVQTPSPAQSPQPAAPAQPAQAWTPAPPSALDAQPTQVVAPQQSQPPAYRQASQSAPYSAAPSPASQPQPAAYPAPTAVQPTAYQQPQSSIGYGQVPPPPTEVRSSRDEPDPRRPAAALPGDEPRPRSRRKVFLASGIGAVAVIGVVTVLVLNASSSGGGSHASAPPSGFQPTGTSLTGDAEQTANAFLAAWQSGNFKKAAAYTDDPAAASTTLASFASGLNLNGLQLAATGATAVTPPASGAASAAATASPDASGSSSSTAPPPVPSSTAGVVTFNVVAKVGLPPTTTSSTASASTGASGAASASSSGSPSATSSGASASASGTALASAVSANWSYSSKVTAYKKNGGWWIQWVPSLVAPNLTATNKLVSSAIAPSAAAVQDANGNDLSSATDPGVHNIYLALKKSAPAGQGTPGVQIQLESATGTPVTGSTDVLSQPVNTGIVKTTINPSAEAAAQQAVLAHPDSSMVVLQPTTGDILAVANNDGGNDFALTARVAPGSTNKIITSTALLANNLVASPSTAVTCPPTITVNGTVFHNSNNESEPAGTPFLTDFAASCNNAFGQWYSTIGSSTLATTAQKYYGLNQQWNLGTGPAGPYYNIPTSASDGELFQELFGQGELETAPVAMASVGATVDTGTFKQPIFVPGTPQLAATPLPSNVQQDLYQMMKAVVTQPEGTAYNLFSGVNSTVYGKTGTADVSINQKNPNSWMVVFDPTLNLAIGCVVLDAGAGAEFAGPEAAAVLKALQ